MLTVVEIDITSDIIIQCPAVGFRHRRAYIACQKCDYFDGIGEMGKEGTWHERYTIRCCHPMERRCQIIPTVLEE